MRFITGLKGAATKVMIVLIALGVLIAVVVRWLCQEGDMSIKFDNYIEEIGKLVDDTKFYEACLKAEEYIKQLEAELHEYEISEFVPPGNIHCISATQIRDNVSKQNDGWKKYVDGIFRHTFRPF